MQLHRMNPLDIVIAAEAASCKGCAREMAVRFGNEVRMGCTTGRKHGDRCKHYKPGKGTHGRQQ